MTAAELRTLFDGDLVHPGGHTISHRRLSALTRTEQEFEIQGSRMRLQEILSRTVEDFSYPFGGQRDYTRDCVRAVERAGYLRACSNIHGTVGLGTSRFELPRVHVVNVGGAAFASFLGSL
jgi:peptidoglycan/xylan/chitin deacetylase (PgdA/CDA1 family)